MEFFRRATNPWNQEVLIGISWTLLWAAVIAGLAFVIGHAVYAKWIHPKRVGPADATPSASSKAVPDRIVRHSAAARAFHWLMSITMFVLLITAFFPVIGIRFPWVTIHWIAGVGLLLTVIYHIVHATFWLDFKSMWTGRREIAEAKAGLRQFLRRGGNVPKAGKYPFDHQLYHHTTALVSAAAIVTGVLMMFRVDTPFWDRNPYLLSDGLWGVVYVVHGLSGVALVTMVMAHVYFAIRPEKWWITRSMISGWITRQQYLQHFDPARWVVNGNGKRAVGPPAGSRDAEPKGARDKQSVN